MTAPASKSPPPNPSAGRAEPRAARFGHTATAALRGAVMTGAVPHCDRACQRRARRHMARLVAITCQRCGEAFGGEAEFAAHRTGHGECLSAATLGMRLVWNEGIVPTIWRDGQCHD